MTASPAPHVSLAVLVSGGGTTFVNLQQQITAGALPAEIRLVVADRPCKGLERAAAAGIPHALFPWKEQKSLQGLSEAIFARCREAQIKLVTLGGFLQRVLVPADFEQRVMNIHPSLIPAFCGKGMYGRHVHQAVLERGCKVSGCTVHFCDNEYDHGPIILQQTVPVLEEDDAGSLAARVFAAECEAYPEAIRLFAAGRLQVRDRRVIIAGE